MANRDNDQQVAPSALASDSWLGQEASHMSVTYRGTVYPSQCDHMGHMNVMWYVAKFDEASWQLLAALGLTPTRLKREGIGMAAVDQRIEYKRELRAGDVVTIRSSLLEVTDKSIRLFHEMRNDETKVVAATTTVVAVHFDTWFRRARSLPADLRERATVMIAERSRPRADEDTAEMAIDWFLSEPVAGG